MTLKEIAQEANVSISTVSRVINGKGKSAASQAVCDRIWDIINQNNYIPNAAAKDLRMQRGEAYKESVGYLECFLARMPFSEKDQFFSQLARSLEKEALSLNYEIKYSFTARGLKQRDADKELANSHASGLAILGRCDEGIAPLLEKHFTNICYVGLNHFSGNCDQVICDGMEAGKTAVHYLLDLGHERIGYLGETQGEIRYLGYQQAMQERGLCVNPAYVCNAELSYKGGYEGTKKLLTATPDLTSVFCANDNTAIGAMSALQEMGLRIPEQISVIGVDNIETSRYVTPALTTICIPITEMGKIAAKILVDRIQGGHREQIKVHLPSKLEIRESCAIPRK